VKSRATHAAGEGRNDVGRSKQSRLERCERSLLPHRPILLPIVMDVVGPP